MTHPDRTAGAPLDRSIPFIDTHTHLWELSRFRYDWLAAPRTDDELGDYRAICVDWGPGRFFRELYGQNVVATVHVEADYSGPDPVEETAWLESVARDHKMPNALIVMCDITIPGASAALERHLVASPRVRGIRLRRHPADPGRGAFGELVRHDLSYELDASPGSLLPGLDVARAHPDLLVVLGHAGFPVRRDPAYREWWARELTAVAAADNVAIKVSGLATVDHAWSVDSLRPWVLGCIDAFGVERVMFGTNWPVETLFSPYIEAVDAWRRIIADAGFSHDEQERMLFRNAQRLYRI